MRDNRNKNTYLLVNFLSLEFFILLYLGIKEIDDI